MDKWAELKIKTDLKAFENELKKFARLYREANLVDIYVSEWQKAMSDLHPIDITGSPVDREEGCNFAIQFTRQIQGKPWLTPSNIEVTFYVSRIGGAHPLLLEIPPGVIDSYKFVEAFLSRCSELWETSPIERTAVAPTENMPQQDLKLVTNIYVGRDYVGGNKTTVGNISDSTNIAVGPGASVNEGDDPQGEYDDTAVPTPDDQTLSLEMREFLKDLR